MKYERWLYLETHENAELTKEELQEGWHWCPEWDFLLVGPDMKEWEVCLCKNFKKENK